MNIVTLSNEFLEGTVPSKSTKGFVLLVENDVDVRERFAQFLSLEGYTVFACKNEIEALEICRQNPVDLALVDYRLRDDNNPNDKTGHHLAKKLDGRLVKILMSAFQPETFGKVKTGNTFQFDKNEGPEALIQFINEIFDKDVQVNHDLDIQADFDFDKLFKQIKRFRSYNNQVHERQRFELDGLIKRLFFLEKRVQLKYIQPGYGGSGVVRVTPFYESEGGGSISGADVVVKFGPVENMEREFDRYSRYVETFLGMSATDVVGSMKVSGRLAGIKFRLIGSQADWQEAGKVLSFRDAFTDLNPDQLDAVIADLFQNTCRLWYAGKYQAKREKKLLAPEYADHFNLNSVRRLDEVEGIIESIVSEGDSDRLTVSFYDENHLEFDFNNNLPYPYILANPLVFIEKHADLLPEVYYRSITHGDMNEGNIFVDPESHTWLIDFFKTGEGPALRDVIQLETAIKFFLYREPNLVRRLLFESAALSPNQFQETKENLSLIEADGNTKATISAVRRQACEINGNEDMAEFYAGMLYNTLRVMTLENIDPNHNEVETRIRRKHALFSAALLAQKFSHQI